MNASSSSGLASRAWVGLIFALSMTAACVPGEPGLADARGVVVDAQFETADAQVLGGIDASVDGLDAGTGARMRADAMFYSIDAATPSPMSDAAIVIGQVDAAAPPVAPTLDAAPANVDAAVASIDAAVASIDAAPAAPLHDTIIATLSVAGGPFGMASDGVNMWVACQIGNTVDKFDLATLTLQDTILGDGAPFDVASIDSTLWVVDNYPGAVSRIDETNDSVDATISVPANRYPTGFAFDGTYVWVADNYGDNVLKIDPATNTIVDTVAIGAETWGVVFDGAHVWVSAYGSNYIAEIDPATDDVIANVTVSSSPMFLAFDGTDVWVTGFISDTVDRVDASTGAVVASLAFTVGVYNIINAGGYVWMTTLDSHVLKIDPATDAIVDSIAVPNPYGIAFDGTDLWVSSRDQNLISIIAP